MNTRKVNGWDLLIWMLLLLYVGSMIWINFHSALWYRMDCYTYAYEGRLMYETCSLFPENWIFSNQYHIIASPNLAAAFYGITKDSLSAMALASSFSAILVLISFLWCLKPFVGKRALLAGALCLLGGVILGTSAALYISGLQVLYTMCSYYACYMIVILLTLGIWLRLHTGERVSILMVILTVLLNFALGMQSLREMLVLVIPLFLSELLFSFYPLVKGKAKFRFSKIAILYLTGVFVAELGGYLIMDSLHIPTTPNIGGLELDIIPSHLLANFWASTKNLLRISGLAIAMDGLHYLPLSICGLCIAAAIFLTIILIFKNKDCSPLAKIIVFSLLSVLCVYGIGIFLMRTRDIYYFVYWLLAALCIVYLLNHGHSVLQKLVLAALSVICCINYCYNFLPDFKDYKENHEKLEIFAQSLADRGIQIIYTDSMPIVAAASHDRIVSQSYWLDFPMESGYPLTFFPSDKHTVVYDDAHYENSLICISNRTKEAIHTASDTYQESLFSNLELFDRFDLRGESYLYFRSKKRLISPLAF